MNLANLLHRDNSDAASSNGRPVPNRYNNRSPAEPGEAFQ